MRFLTVNTPAETISVQISLILVFTGEWAVMAITAAWSAVGSLISIVPWWACDARLQGPRPSVARLAVVHSNIRRKLQIRNALTIRTKFK
jgi:hypothetical protein